MPSAIDRYFPSIEAELKRSIKPIHTEADGLYRMIRYFLGWEDESGKPVHVKAGKRYRPILCLMVCDALGFSWKRALPAAAALEIFHNFTLVHDDIQDHDLLRRGRKTVWSIWGMEQGINAGDVMYGLSARAALRSAHALEVVKILTEASIKIVEGQYLDMSFMNRDRITQAEYLMMLKAKTSVLVGAAAEIGALVGTGKKGDRSLWKKFGETFGFAYQLYDDYQGVWGTTDKTGKQEAGDVREGKKTLPFISALNGLPAQKSRRLAALYRLPTRGRREIREAITLMEESGADRETKRRALQEKEVALRVLRQGKLRKLFHDEFVALVHRLIPWQKL